MVKKYLKYLSKKPFIKNVASLASGTIVAQVIVLVFSPIITRIYDPEVFGVFGVFNSAISIVSPVAALTFPIAIVLPKSDINALGLMRLSLYLSILLATCVAILLILFQTRIAAVLQIEEIKGFLFLIPLVIVFASLQQIMRQWLIREKQFGTIAKISWIQSLLINSTKAMVGLIYPLAISLVSITTIGKIIHAGLLYLNTKRKNYFEIVNSGKSNCQEKLSLTKLAKKHIDFPLYRAPQVFMNVVSVNLPIILLASFFGPAAAGFYTISQRVLALPSRILGQSVGEVFYPRITEEINNRKPITKYIIRSTTILALIGLIPFLFIILFGPSLFAFVFGDQWGVSGQYGQWLSIFLFFGFINKPSVNAIPALKLQRGLLFYEILSTGAKVLALYLGFLVIGTDIAAIMLFSIFGAVTYIILIGWILYNAKMFDNNLAS